MWIVSLFPVAIAATTVSPQHFDTQDGLEHATTDYLRSALKAGWTLVGQDGDENSAYFDLTAGSVSERVTATIDGEHHEDGGRLTVMPIAQPIDYLDPMLIDAVKDPNAVLYFEEPCGNYLVFSYAVSERATGKAAAKLVGSTLASADDIEGATWTAGTATFEITRGGSAATMVVDLDDGNQVVSAEIRDGVGSDYTRFRATKKLRRFARGHAIDTIDGDDANHPILVLGDKQFSFEDDQFVENPRDPSDSGCGC
jgi:hypothetical protein